MQGERHKGRNVRVPQPGECGAGHISAIGGWDDIPAQVWCMESMVKEQEKQGKRLETLEDRDGEMWRKAVGYVVTAVIGVFLGYVFTQLGF